MKFFKLWALSLLLLLPPGGAEEIFPQVAARVRSAFVFVAGGSGVVINPRGEVVTNNHVVENLTQVRIALGDGREFTAEVIGRDRQGDLALLQIRDAGGNFPFIPLGTSADLRRGEPCLAIGNPLALGLSDRSCSFSAGVISALHQFRQGYNDAIVVDAAINPGNSGGPLVNARGELIGICGMTQTRLGLKSNTGVAFAIPVDQLKLWLPFLRRARGGNVFHGRLQGVEFTENNGKIQVREVVPHSSAAAAGLRAGDVIAEYMGYHVPTVARFDSISGIYPAGSPLTVVVRRAESAGRETVKNLRFSLPPLRPWKTAFAVARPGADGEYPVIVSVFPDGRAERAGLLPGDEIMAINNLPVTVGGLAQLGNYLANLNSGDRVRLQIRRAGSQLTISFIAE